MARIRLYSHRNFLDHEAGSLHPESPDRLRAIFNEMDRRDLREDFDWVCPEPLSLPFLEKVHERRYLRKLLSHRGESFFIDTDTGGNPSTLDAALRASGAAVAATDAVLDGSARTAFIFNRPPGHHAEPDLAMGFCFVNHAAVAAAYATEERGLRRVMIIDPDVHHGNGTQKIFYHRGDVFYLSLHQYPFYPGSGNLSETGVDNGRGTTLNLPLEGGATDADYHYLLKEVALPAIEHYQPQLVIFSAGFDALGKDPLGGMALSTEGLTSLYHRFYSVLQENSIPCFFLLEGGYHPHSLAVSVTDLLCRMRDQRKPAPPPEGEVSRQAQLLADHFRQNQHLGF